MDRGRVAEFYRGKGYLVHESIVVTGQSGNQQRVPLLCEGPLGNLAVFFGDAAGIDGHEIGAAKRVARDLGATAVVAAGAFTSAQRLTAADLGVVLVDDLLLGQVRPAPEPRAAWPGPASKDTIAEELAIHPWPASGRPGGSDATSRAALSEIDQVLDRFERAHAAAAKAAPAGTANPVPSQAPVPAASPVQVTPSATPRSSDGGLWKRGQPAVAPAAPVQEPAPRPATTVPRGGTPAMPKPGSFTWLARPAEPAVAAEAEYAGTVPTHAAPTAERLAADRQARHLREAQLRVLVRRGAWVLGAAVVVYLFLLWWL